MNFSTVDLCPDAAVNVTEKADDDRANFLRAMCDELPRNASIPLPISATAILFTSPHAVPAALVGANAISTAPKAVVELSAAAGVQTPLRTAETCSTDAFRGATDIPSGSIPATGDAVLGSQNAVQSL